MQTPDDGNLCILVVAPIGRDGAAMVDLLQRGGMKAAIRLDLPGLIAGLDQGCAAVLATEEALFGQNLSLLAQWIERQPAWSDLPFVVLTSRLEQQPVVAWRRRLITTLRNVSLLERPVKAITLTTTMRAAVRARVRQHEVRDLLGARERAAQALEAQVLERTKELRAEMAERQRVEETLRQAQKIEAIGQLTGGVAHDFNNLLMVISGGLEMLDRQTDPARRRRIMDGMQQATQRGAGLTRQLLTFSRRQSLKPETVDLKRQIGAMRELLHRSLRGDVDVNLAFDEDLWPIDVDPGELELAVLNLAVNARDAMPHGGTITVTARNVADQDGFARGCVRLAVSDTGTGMTPEVRDRVFEPFFTTKDVGKGSGLGLAQVHGFASQSGGRVSIESGLGQGTSVILLLPRSSAPAAPLGNHLNELNVEKDHFPHLGTVLLVEDDDEVASLVGEMLGQVGYEVTRVASAIGALGALADDRKIDIVFSDIMMPGGMNGIELAHEIRARRAKLPILLTSGRADAFKIDADKAGMRILPKPYRMEELASILEDIIGQQGARQGVVP
ncbi:ATP-binding protein [Azospirillum doebereinerae]